MELNEKLYIIDCPKLGEIMGLVNRILNSDNPLLNVPTKAVINGFSELLRFYLNFQDYNEEYDEIIEILTSLEGFSEFEGIIVYIREQSKDFWYGYGFSDIEIVTPKGLLVLIYLFPY